MGGGGVLRRCAVGVGVGVVCAGGTGCAPGPGMMSGSDGIQGFRTDFDRFSSFSVVNRIMF